MKTLLYVFLLFALCSPLWAQHTVSSKADVINPGDFNTPTYLGYINANIGGFNGSDFNTITQPPHKFDAISSSILIPKAGADLVYQAANYGAYCASRADSRYGVGPPGNHNLCNSWFSISQALATNSAVGGLGETVADAPGTSNTWLGGNEIDFYVFGTPHKVTGFQLTLNGTGSPSSVNAADAIIIQQSAITGAGADITKRWSQGLVISDYATAGNAIAIGTVYKAPTTSASQYLSFNYIDARGKEHFGQVTEAADSFGNVVIKPATGAGAKIAGPLIAGQLISAGTQSVSGCNLSAAVGGSGAGSFKSGTSGTCTVTIRPGITAPNGFTCQATDLTTGGATMKQTAYSSTTCTISGTTASADLITWSAIGF
jgi:hypothetical protein